MAFTTIKRAIMNAKFRKANKHYATDYIFGERTYIPRKGKDPVEVLLYYPPKMENDACLCADPRRGLGGHGCCG